MRAILGIIVAVALCLVTPTPAHAQSIEQAEQALRDVGVWAQHANQINARFVELFRSSDELNHIAEAFSAGQKKEEQAAAEVEAWRRTFTERIAQLRADIDSSLEPPHFDRSLGLQRLEDGTQATVRRMRQSLDQSDAFAAGMVDITLQSIHGETGDGASAMRRATALARQLVEFENGSLALMQMLAPDGHPNINLARARIAMNNGMLVIFDVFGRAVIEDGASFTPEELARMRALVAEMRTEVREGHVAAERSRGIALGSSAGFSPQTRAAFGRLFDSLNETFDTLGEGADFLSSVTDAPSNLEPDPMLALFDRFGVIEEHLQQQNEFRAAQLATAQPQL